MIQRPLTQLSLLEAFVSHEDSLGYVLKESLASPKPLEVRPPPRPPSAAAPSRAPAAPRRAAPTPAAPVPAAQDACTKYPLHEWLKNCQPLKRDKRCRYANSRHIFNSADLWEDMWAEMGTAQKAEICNVNTEELHDKLWQHCTDKHHPQGLPQQRHVGVRQAHQKGLCPRRHAAQFAAQFSGGRRSPTLRAIL